PRAQRRRAAAPASSGLTPRRRAARNALPNGVFRARRIAQFLAAWAGLGRSVQRGGYETPQFPALRSRVVSSKLKSLICSYRPPESPQKKASDTFSSSRHVLSSTKIAFGNRPKKHRRVRRR